MPIQRAKPRFVDSRGTVTANQLNIGQIGGRRNIIINGSQQVAQRATSVTDVGGSQGYFCTDRFKSTISGTAARYTVSQDSDAPAGFSKALKYDVTTADTSVAAAEFHAISYRAEGQDISHFEWGTSDAKKCTFSFYAKATTAQTVVVNFVRSTSGTARSVSKAFSVTTSYQRFTHTFPADTGGSAQVETNAAGLAIHIGFGAGSNFAGGTINETWEDVTNANRFAGVGSLASSTDNNFFITGIQLEVGEQATPFEHRSFGEELALCQRYFEFVNGGIDAGMSVSTSSIQFVYRYRVNKRASATAALVGTPVINDGTQQSNINSVANTYHSFTSGTYLDLSTGTVNNNDTVLIYSNSATVGFSFDAEL